MSELIQYSFFPKEVLAFTTKRTLARDTRRISLLIGVDENRVIVPHQVHSDHILQITPDFLTLTSKQQTELLEGVDALYTDVRGVCIGVSTADCVPILLYDSLTHTIASVHSGWRGTVKRILQKTICCMSQRGSRAENILAVIGPSISCEQYEVGEEVYNIFLAAKFPVNEVFMKQKKWHIDLNKCNYIQLIESGVKAENIYQESLCTYSNPDILFSARREQTAENKCGRNFNAILVHEQTNT